MQKFAGAQMDMVRLHRHFPTHDVPITALSTSRSHGMCYTDCALQLFAEEHDLLHYITTGGMCLSDVCL